MDVALWMVLGAVVVAAVHVATTAVVRWPDARPLGEPWGPRCVTDDHDLSLGDVVPLWSWVARRGRCRHCGEGIPFALPVVEVAVIGVLVAVAWRHAGPELLLLWPVAWSAVVATPIDLARSIIPNRLTYPLAVWSLMAVTVVAVADGAWADWRRALLVGLVLPLGMEVFSQAFRLLRGARGMGLGDVKWAVSLGIAIGWLGGPAVMAFLAATVISSGVVAIVLLATGRAATARIPYGPYLAAGILVAILVPPHVVTTLLT